MAQQYDFCPTAPDDVLPGVLGLLPDGPAWDAARVPSTIQHSFWRAISTVVGSVNAALCAFRLELYCSTATTSVDQWNSEYGINTATDECDVYALLCPKVVAQGGQSCSFYTSTMAALGYVITCGDVAAMNATLPIVGCCQVGCAQLGPASIPIANCAVCYYGPAIDHPFPAFWPSGTPTVDLACAVPGSGLGAATCCNYAGYFQVPAIAVPATVVDTSCAPTPERSVFRYRVPAQANTAEAGGCPVADSSGLLLRYTGYAYQFVVNVDRAASITLHTAMGITTAPSGPAAACLLDTIKPAHTNLQVKYSGAPTTATWDAGVWDLDTWGA